MRTRDDTGRHWSLRAWGLFIGSVACVSRGVLYLPPVASGREPLPIGAETLTSALPTTLFGWAWQPVWLLGALWLIVGVAGLVDVIIGRLANVLFSCMVGLMVGWAIGYLGAAIIYRSIPATASGAFFLACAGWTEVSRRIAPAIPLTPGTAESRLRIVRNPVGADQTEWLDGGRWVPIFPERVG